jgi:hypothetical protein
VELHSSPVAQPFADWTFLEGTLTQKKLVEQEIGEKEQQRPDLHKRSTQEDIKQTLCRIGIKRKALDY